MAEDTAGYCGHCGEPLDVGGVDHTGCGLALQLEPPRYCGQCRRRMKVQVTPTGWAATCSRHGLTHSSPGLA
ncbi:hypothetical protein [Leekyejoonella antrihumi]|uniref:biotin synthase auxiliary protein BsaP n=1 Tax=Leekyejoonella antrihumi TaxID=1660198 RepID=UPI001FE37660|nr:hypothetical protein [Leekyejoonella antrihumi]